MTLAEATASYSVDLPLRVSIEGWVFGVLLNVGWQTFWWWLLPNPLGVFIALIGGTVVMLLFIVWVRVLYLRAAVRQVEKNNP